MHIVKYTITTARVKHCKGVSLKLSASVGHTECEGTGTSGSVPGWWPGSHLRFMLSFKQPLQAAGKNGMTLVQATVNVEPC